MKIIALFLSLYMILGSLIPRTDFSQLLYLGELKVHYLEHKSVAEDQEHPISFLDFLYSHFIDISEHSDVDHEEDHHQLPLQTINFSNFFIIDILMLPELINTSKKVLQKIAYLSPFYLNGFLFPAILPPSF